MPKCEVDPKALAAVMKTAKDFGTMDELWVEAGAGKLIFRSGDKIRYAIACVTLPAPGCESAKPRLLGMLTDKLADVTNGVKGALAVEWGDEGSPNSGRVTFRSGTKRRSFLLLEPKTSHPLRQVPDIPGIVMASLNGDDLKRFLGEAEGVGYVWAARKDGHLVLSCQGDTGDELEWDTGPCEGQEGRLAQWNAKNWGELLPSEYDGETLLVKLHPQGLRTDWTLGGAPCAFALAPMTEAT